MTKKTVLLLICSMVFTGCINNSKKSLGTDSTEVLSCSIVEYIKKDTATIPCLRMIKFTYNRSTGAAKYEPWLFWHYNNDKFVLESDGYAPFLDVSGVAQVNDSIIEFTCEMSEAHKKMINEKPVEKQKILTQLVAQKLGLNRTFVRYITHNKLDTLWNEKGTDFFFRKIR